jgi:hypothetical protein
MISDIREAELSDFDEVIELLEQLWPGKELSRSALMKVFPPALSLWIISICVLKSMRGDRILFAGNQREYLDGRLSRAYK